VTYTARTAHVAEESFHSLDGALCIDEDGAIGPVRDRADHTVTTGRLRHSRPVVYPLDAAERKAMPMYERGHGTSRTGLPKFLPTPGAEGIGPCRSRDAKFAGGSLITTTMSQTRPTQHAEPSRDVPAPPWGPGFLRLNSWVYRAEYAVATIAILALLFGWRWLILNDLPWPGLVLTIFWAIWPDLAAFVPIGIASRKSQDWPSWGPTLYNGVHNLLVWAAVFVVWSYVSGGIVWPLLAWAGHITADRAVGFYLRAPRTGSPEGAEISGRSGSTAPR
jgi:hypothetical protein